MFGDAYDMEDPFIKQREDWYKSIKLPPPDPSVPAMGIIGTLAGAMAAFGKTTDENRKPETKGS